MKTILPLVFCLMINSELRSQDWPLGTTWVYDQIDFQSSNPYNFVIYRISGDTIVQNKATKILQLYFWYSNLEQNQKNHKVLNGWISV